jgi:hypothetical protein
VNAILRTFAGFCWGVVFTVALSTQTQPVHLNFKPEVPCYDPAPAQGAPNTTTEVTLP